MSIFSMGRRETLSNLRMADEAFVAIESPEAELSQQDSEQPSDVTPANELATAIVERDIAEAVRLDNPEPTELIEMPAPLSQRHLETIDRMVAHLKADEKRLERQIADARRQLADTQLARHGYERNSTELRRGIALLLRLANTKPATPRPRRPKSAAAVDVGQGSTEAQITVLKSRSRRRMH